LGLRSFLFTLAFALAFAFTLALLGFAAGAVKRRDKEPTHDAGETRDDLTTGTIGERADQAIEAIRVHGGLL
jgi:hypothetical protein